MASNVQDKDDTQHGFHSRGHSDSPQSGSGFDNTGSHEQIEGGLSPHDSAVFEQAAAGFNAGEEAAEPGAAESEAGEHNAARDIQDSPDHPSTQSDRGSNNQNRNRGNGKTDHMKKPTAQKGAGDQPSADRTRQLFQDSKQKRLDGLAKGASKLGTPAGTAKYVLQHRKQLGAAGIVLVLLISLVFGLGLLSHLKLETMIKNFLERRVTTRLDDYLERRAEQMVLQYFINGGDSISDKSIVTYAQPIRDMYRTWRVNKFEAKLEANQGVKFERVKGGGAIRVFKDGKLVGDLNNKDAKNAIKLAVRDETRLFQIVKRHHLNQWLRNAYKIEKWKPYDGKSGEKDATTEVREGALNEAAPYIGDQVAGEFDCISGSDCLKDEGNPDEVNRKGNLPEAQSNTGANAADGTVQDGANQAVQQAEQDAQKEADKTGQKLTDKIVTKILGKTIGPIVTKILQSVSGPLIILGIVDILSRIDHALYAGGLDHAIAQFHKIQYAAQATHWAQRSDQIKEAALGPGKASSGSAAVGTGVVAGAPLSSDEFNATMEYLEHTENAASMQTILTGGHGGQSLYTSNEAYDAKKTNDESNARSIDETATPIADWYKKYIGNIPTGNPVPLPCLPPTSVHCNLAFWWDTGGQVMNWLNSVIGFLLKPIILIIQQFPGVKWLLNNVANLLTYIFKVILPPAVDGTEVGADLANGIDAGFAVIGMDFSRDLGGHLLSVADANQLDAKIADDQAQQDNHVGLWTRLFSTDYTHSFINNLAIAAPVNLQDAATEGADRVASMMTTPLSTVGQIFSLIGIGKASADNLSENNFGLHDWGYTNAELDDPIVKDQPELDQAYQNTITRTAETAPHNGEMTFEDCPKVNDPDHHPNICRLDLAAIQSMTARFTTDDDGGIGSKGGQ